MFSFSECALTSVASMLITRGSNRVANAAGFRFPAACQIRERILHMRVVKPWAKASDWFEARATNRDTAAFDGTGPKSPGLLRNTSRSETCSPPPASITARDPMTRPGRCMAWSGTNWEKRSSHRDPKPVASRKDVSTFSPAWEISDWPVRMPERRGKSGYH